MSETKIRCFVGVSLDAVAMENIQNGVHTLQQNPALRAVRWVAPRNWHLTLAFLGERSESWISQLQPVLQQSLLVLPAEAKQSIHLQGHWISGFPDAQSRIVALEFHPSNLLNQFKESLDAALQTHDFKPDTRDFRPHVTLGRWMRGKTVHFNPVVCDVQLEIHQINLYQSTLTADGSEYQIHWSLPLRTLIDNQ